MSKEECTDHGGIVLVAEHERLPLSRRAMIAAAFSTVAIATVPAAHGRDSPPPAKRPAENCGYEYAYVYVY